MQLECASPYCTEVFAPKVHNQKYHKAQCKRDAENIARRRVATAGSASLKQEVEIYQEEAAGFLSDDELYDKTLEQQLEYVRGMNRALARENAKLKAIKYEIGHYIHQTIKENISDLKIPAVKQYPVPDRRSKVSETAISVLSDWQVGKKTLDYNVDKCEERIEIYGDKLIRISELQRADHPVKNQRVWLLGDMVEGEAIFPSQAHHLDKSLYYQVAVDGPRIIVNFLRRMLGQFERIHVVGIPGNHGAIGGRARHEMHPETNADRMLYSIVQQILQEEERITWQIPSGELEGDFYTIDSIGVKKFLLLHGHQIPGRAGVPFAGIEKRIKGWAMGAIPEKFDYAFMGHFHTPSRMTINTVTAWINGTTESSNGYAVEVLAAVGRPCQYLFFAHPEHGITAEYPIFLDHVDEKVLSKVN